MHRARLDLPLEHYRAAVDAAPGHLNVRRGLAMCLQRLAREALHPYVGQARNAGNGADDESRTLRQNPGGDPGSDPESY